MKHFALLVFFGLIPVSGCSVSSGEPDTVVVAGSSTLTVTWTVDGTDDPRACAAEGADSIDVVVASPSGALVSEVVDDCQAGITHVSLPPGDYRADAALLDAAGHEITTRVALGPMTLYGNDDLVVDADFPSDSFY